MNPTTRVLSLLTLLPIAMAQADDGGISFWLPGQFGALAAAPTTPGWSLPLAYYHVNASDGRHSATPRGGRTVVGLDAKADLLFASPTYTFATPVLGGAQAAISAVRPRTIRKWMKNAANAHLIKARGDDPVNSSATSPTRA